MAAVNWFSLSSEFSSQQLLCKHQLCESSEQSKLYGRSSKHTHSLKGVWFRYLYFIGLDTVM